MESRLSRDLILTCCRNILANKDLVLRHIDAYFEHLYFTPCLGYLHKETVYKELEVSHPWQVSGWQDLDS